MPLDPPGLGRAGWTQPYPLSGRSPLYPDRSWLFSTLAVERGPASIRHARSRRPLSHQPPIRRMACRTVASHRRCLGCRDRNPTLPGRDAGRNPKPPFSTPTRETTQLWQRRPPGRCPHLRPSLGRRTSAACDAGGGYRAGRDSRCQDPGQDHGGNSVPGFPRRALATRASWTARARDPSRRHGGGPSSPAGLSTIPETDDAGAVFGDHPGLPVSADRGDNAAPAGERHLRHPCR